MVGSILPRSVSHSVADTAGVASGAGNLKAAIAMRVAGALAPNPNPPGGRIGWTSRALAVRIHRSGLMAAHSVPAGDNNNSTDSLSGPPAPVSTSSPSPSPTTAATRAPAPVPVLAITCGAVGGVVALAVILALVYVRRVRRRVKSMKRLTNVLGPGALPLSPTQPRAARQHHRLSVVHAHLLFWLRTCADVAVPVTIAIDDRLAPCQVRWDARRRPATDGFRSDQSLASAERFVS